MKKRRLSDLYVRGREITVNDGEGEPVTVWLNKLNEIERESVIRRAGAAKARFMIDADDEESEIFTATYAEVREVADREELVLLVVSEDVANARRRIEGEIAGDEETWAKDDYLQGLLDLWIGDDDNPGLAATRTEDPNDPEAKRVNDELERFEVQVRDEVKAESDRLMKDWESADLDLLRRKAAHRLLEMRATEEFAREYRRQQLFYTVREPADHHKRYFATVAEVDDLDPELRAYIVEQYESLIVPPDEGKDSQPPADSSEPPEPVEVAEENSGLVTATA